VYSGGYLSFLYLDGLWISLSKPVKAKKVLLMALGVKGGGSKELLDFQLANNEPESWWWGFLSDLKDQGLKGENLEVMVSDGAGGLIKAFCALYPRVTQQLCTFHKVNDLDLHLLNRAHRSHILSDALFIFE
jgi:transposase-like protein